jgi:hypothetical protein
MGYFAIKPLVVAPSIWEVTPIKRQCAISSLVQGGAHQSAAALVRSRSVHLSRTTGAFLLTDRPDELNALPVSEQPQ